MLDGADDEKDETEERRGAEAKIALEALREQSTLELPVAPLPGPGWLGGPEKNRRGITLWRPCVALS